VQVRAETIRGGRYYRMDTWRAPEEHAYRWPTQVLSAERIRNATWESLGGLEANRGQQQGVYVPLTVRQNRAPVCEGYDLILSPGERLTGFTSLAVLDSTGKPAQFIKRDLPPELRLLPAGNPIPVRIKSSDLPQPGLYYLKPPRA
jgi:hypothetical protein